MSILNMNFERLLHLNPESLHRLLVGKEIRHLFDVCDAIWQYDYQALENGIPGDHALLKSFKHSDGFIVAPDVLQHPNLRRIIAYQMAERFKKLKLPMPKWVVGVPKAASELAHDVAGYLRVKNSGGLVKQDKEIVVADGVTFKDGETILLIEDICTAGTGFLEAVSVIYSANPRVIILPVEMVIWNRGGKRILRFHDIKFRIHSLYRKRINDWEERDCPLCPRGSKAIKPKVTLEIWQAFKQSQKRAA